MLVIVHVHFQCLRSRDCKMAKWIKVLATKLDDLSLIWGPTWRKGSINSFSTRCCFRILHNITKDESVRFFPTGHQSSIHMTFSWCPQTTIDISKHLFLTQIIQQKLNTSDESKRQIHFKVSLLYGKYSVLNRTPNLFKSTFKLTRPVTETVIAHVVQKSLESKRYR